MVSLKLRSTRYDPVLSFQLTDIVTTTDMASPDENVSTNVENTVDKLGDESKTYGTEDDGMGFARPSRQRVIDRKGGGYDLSFFVDKDDAKDCICAM